MEWDIEVSRGVTGLLAMSSGMGDVKSGAFKQDSMQDIERFGIERRQGEGGG